MLLHAESERLQREQGDSLTTDSNTARIQMQAMPGMGGPGAPGGATPGAGDQRHASPQAEGGAPAGAEGDSKPDSEAK